MLIDPLGEAVEDVYVLTMPTFMLAPHFKLSGVVG
jgi:hypothetical protein